MTELFPKIENFRIIRLCEIDAINITDHLRDFKDLILENQPMYPNIDKWFDRKVVPGMKSSERIGYIGYFDEKPVASAVVKRGMFAKFCHLRIKEDLQNIHLGEAFFALMGLETKDIAKEIHFTLPESVWESKKGFFKGFGFTHVSKIKHRYRPYGDELKCSLRFDKFWVAIHEKLPKISRILSMNECLLNEDKAIKKKGDIE